MLGADARLLQQGAYGDWSSTGVFESALTREELWAVLSQEQSWTEWWEELEAVRLRGPLEPGTRGTMRLRGLPPLRVTVRAASAPSLLALQVVTGPLLAEFEFALHELPGGGTEIRERVSIVGPAARMVGRFFDLRRGPNFGLSMTRLVSLAVVASHAGPALRGR
ncbi:MAG: SRPBCC family protein [Solirubrobacteraceae bacterium]